MKKKIKEALKLKYGTRANKELGHLQLGLSDEVFERVAASVETFITEESAIEAWVNSESTLNLLKSYQSEADKARAQARAGNESNQGSSESGENGTTGKEESAAKGSETPDIAAIISAALDAKLKPLTDKIAGFEAEQAKKTAMSSLDKFIEEWSYAKGFPKESAEAKRIAIKLYKAGGEQMTAEQLISAYREEFEPAVQSKGDFDFTKPYQNQNGGGGDEMDFSSFDRAMDKLGWERNAGEN